MENIILNNIKHLKSKFRSKGYLYAIMTGQRKRYLFIASIKYFDLQSFCCCPTRFMKDKLNGKEKVAVSNAGNNLVITFAWDIFHQLIKVQHIHSHSIEFKSQRWHWWWKAYSRFIRGWTLNGKVLISCNFDLVLKRDAKMIENPQKKLKN